MKRLFTATCLAATFAVGLAAQSTGSAATATDQASKAGAQRPARTVTGCLKAGDTAGSYTLTDVVMQGAAGAGAATSSGGTTAGSTASTTGSTAASGTSASATPPSSITLNPATDVDLKAHVGHKVEVTGTLAGGRSPDAAGTTGTGGTTAAGSATTGSGAGTSTSSGASARPSRSMTVSSVRMVSESCS